MFLSKTAQVTKSLPESLPEKAVYRLHGETATIKTHSLTHAKLILESLPVQVHIRVIGLNTSYGIESATLIDLLLTRVVYPPARATFRLNEKSTSAACGNSDDALSGSTGVEGFPPHMSQQYFTGAALP